MFAGSRLLARSGDKIERATVGITDVHCGSVPWLAPIGLCSRIVLLQLAETQYNAQRVVDALRSSAYKAALENISRDYLFIPAYVAFLTLLSVTVARFADAREWPLDAHDSRGDRCLAAGGGLLDAVENIALLAMLISGRAARRSMAGR